MISKLARVPPLLQVCRDDQGWSIAFAAGHEPGGEREDVAPAEFPARGGRGNLPMLFMAEEAVCRI